MSSHSVRLRYGRYAGWTVGVSGLAGGRFVIAIAPPKGHDQVELVAGPSYPQGAVIAAAGLTGGVAELEAVMRWVVTEADLSPAALNNRTLGWARGLTDDSASQQAAFDTVGWITVDSETVLGDENTRIRIPPIRVF